MSRKPFSEVTESYFRNEMREPLVRGHDNRSAACLLANAAIAQDKEYALRRIREENHEGMIYYRERDEARAERDALRADNARQAEEWRKARVENCALREEVAALNATNKKDGEDIQKLLQEIERLKAQVGAEQLDADRVRLASRELQAENERLKELQGVPGVSEKGLMAVGEELIRLKTQLAEAVTLLRGCTSTGCAFVVPEPDTFGTADMCDCRHKAREFLAKAKP